MKKVFLSLTFLILTLSLISCSKKSLHPTSNIIDISIFDINDKLIYSVDNDQVNDFMEELNDLTFKSHSGIDGFKYSRYIIISYENYQTKITPILTKRINENGKKTRNRNREYNEIEFYNLIDNYQSN